MKYLRFRLLVLLCVLAYSLGSFAYNFEVDGIYYKLMYDNTIEVTEGDVKYSGFVNIPEKIQYNNRYYYVTAIGYRAFLGCDGLTSVSIPNTVTTIDAFAFYYSKQSSKAPWFYFVEKNAYKSYDYLTIPTENAIPLYSPLIDEKKIRLSLKGLGWII